MWQFYDLKYLDKKSYTDIDNFVTSQVFRQKLH